MNSHNWLDLATLPGEHGREDKQYGWQNLFGNLLQETTILDVGAGLGYSRQRLKSNNNKVTLQDPGPNLPVDISAGIETIESKSFDVVTAFDVIEHIENNKEFISHMLRIAKRLIVITTPNFNVSGCKNPYHCIEYTPSQLVELFEPKKICLLMSGKNMIHKIHSLDSFITHDDPSQAIMVSPL